MARIRLSKRLIAIEPKVSSAILACIPAVSDPARDELPIELSSVVSALESVARELTKGLSREEMTRVVAELGPRLESLIQEQRGPNRPFSR
jgi:hypothetical protein